MISIKFDIPLIHQINNKTRKVMTTTSKKITKATVKSFIKKNRETLFINCKSSFSGMTDMVERNPNAGFKIAQTEERNAENTFGIAGAWFVGYSRDYFKAFENADFTGIEVYNSCGSFILAILK